MSFDQQIEAFLASDPFAVVGASPNRAKYGNKVLRAYLQNQRNAYPVHPTANVIENQKVFPNLAALPESVHGVSVVTPPHVTEQVVEQVGQMGIGHLWLQPGAESARAIERSKQLGINIIAGGPCLLVVLGYRDSL